jgi:acyl-ACP thioesterase
MPQKSAHYLKKFDLHHYDFTPWMKIRPDRVMDFFSETAWVHADQLGLGYEHLQKVNQIWVLGSASLRFRDHVERGQQAQVYTHISGQQGLFYTRELSLQQADGRPLVDCRTRWIVLHADTRRPSRTIILPEDTPEPLEPLFEGAFPKLKKPQTDQVQHSYEVRAGIMDMDTNMHVTNTAYIRWALENYAADFLATHSVSRLDIHFTGESFAGDHIHAERYPVQDKALHYEHHIINQSRNKVVAQLRLQWLPDSLTDQ